MATLSFTGRTPLAKIQPEGSPFIKKGDPALFTISGFDRELPVTCGLYDSEGKCLTEAPVNGNEFSISTNDLDLGEYKVRCSGSSQNKTTSVGVTFRVF